MSQIESLELNVDRLRERHARMCELKQPVDPAGVERCLREFYAGLKIGVPPITQYGSLKKYARAAWAARAARDAWDAWDARAARAARDAWDATYISGILIGAAERNDLETARIWRPIFQAFEFGLWTFFPLNETCPWLPVPKVQTELRVDLARRTRSARCHSATGPAFELPEEKIWFIHGVMVPQYVVENPKAITVADIDTEQNAEVRRVKVERYGQARYLVDAGAVEIHRDDFGVLYRREFANDEPLVMVKVVNSTPESDGSFKDYFLRVPPAIDRARQAVAWTFGKSEMDYDPEVQT